MVKFRLSFARSWLSLGPGWAALAGALSTGYPGRGWLPLLGLWLLVDPVLGTLWRLAGQQGLWRTLAGASLPPPPGEGFTLPYARSEAPGGRLVLWLRRYGRWWRGQFWPQEGDKLATMGLGVLLALGLAWLLEPTIFWLTALAIGLTLLAGQDSADLAAPGGGRLQSVVQFLLPWAMGVVVWGSLTPVGLALALCWWVTYLGGLRMLGHHRRAAVLFFGGQGAALAILLALRLVFGAAAVGVLLIAQQLVASRFTDPADFLPRVRLYLVVAVLVTGLAMGSL